MYNRQQIYVMYSTAKVCYNILFIYNAFSKSIILHIFSCKTPILDEKIKLYIINLLNE